ncbi:hypothetical protein [Runella sp. MFBS21]|uniref:hypothetical protein n=1 Tax=Runella sp. MFBS21 TaxID=3034018 RepID=UPI0023F91198|nr:hypothetical protein [Runella sp. MFBS21]
MIKIIRRCLFKPWKSVRENRLKLMMIVALLYAFLLSLLRAEFSHWQQLLLRLGCHRTGKRCREASAPLYRIRIAFTHLWTQNSG